MIHVDITDVLDYSVFLIKHRNEQLNVPYVIQHNITNPNHIILSAKLHGYYLKKSTVT